MRQTSDSDSKNQQVLYFPEEGIMKAVRQFPSPFFLYEEARLRENCRNFKKAFEKYFPAVPDGQPGFQPLYAVKANSNPAILRIIQDEGFAFDVSSETECLIVKKICDLTGVDTKSPGMFTGNYNPASELKIAKDAGFILNLDDVSMIGDGALHHAETISVPETLSFRINPGVGKATIASNVFAGPNAKYGVPFEKAAEAYGLAKKAGAKHFGIHMMTGSNVPMEDQDYFANIVRKLFDIVADIKKKTGIEIEFMNIGGGFGVPYKPEEKSLDMEMVAKSIREVFDEQCAAHMLKEPKLMAEPGRFIVADAGWLVAKVIVIKDSYKKFIGINAASNDMPRPSIYGAYHEVSVIKKSEVNNFPKEIVSVVGSICENNDQFAKDRELPVCEIGDIVVIHNCGGHAFAMGHHYNGKLLHAEYLLQAGSSDARAGPSKRRAGPSKRRAGELRMIRRAETFEDLYRTTEGL